MPCRPPSGRAELAEHELGAHEREARAPRDLVPEPGEERPGPTSVFSTKSARRELQPEPPEHGLRPRIALPVGGERVRDPQEDEQAEERGAVVPCGLLSLARATDLVDRAARGAGGASARSSTACPQQAPGASSSRRRSFDVDRQRAARPAATGSPTFLWSTTPTAGSMRLVHRLAAGAQQHGGVADARGRRCAPRGRRARRAARASRGPGAAAPGRRTRAGRRPAARSPRWNFRRPAPERERLAHAAPRRVERRAPCPPRKSIQAASSIESDSRSSGPRPLRVSMHSADLERVARGAAEGLVHVGDERGDLLAHAAADRDHRLGQRLASPSKALHEGAVAGLHVEHERVDALGHLLAHDRGGDERQALDRGRDVAQRVELAVGGGDLGRLADQAEAALAAARRGTRRGSGRRGSPGSTRACRGCRRCGRGRGPRSSARRRRRPRRAAPSTRLVLSPTPPVECLSTLRPGQLARGRAPRPSASSPR